MNCNLHAKINPLLPKLLVIEVFDHSGPKGTRASLSLIWRRKKSELRNGNDLLRVLQLHAEPIPQPYLLYISVGLWNTVSQFPTECLGSPEQTAGVYGGFHLVLSAEMKNIQEEFQRTAGSEGE